MTYKKQEFSGSLHAQPDIKPMVNSSLELLNDRLSLLFRAREIANQYRKEHSMNDVQEYYNSSVPEFQETIHPAHSFNKYLKELRERYIHV